MKRLPLTTLHSVAVILCSFTSLACDSPAQAPEITKVQANYTKEGNVLTKTLTYYGPGEKVYSVFKVKFDMLKFDSPDVKVENGKISGLSSWDSIVVGTMCEDFIESSLTWGKDTTYWAKDLKLRGAIADYYKSPDRKLSFIGVTKNGEMMLKGNGKEYILWNKNHGSSYDSRENRFDANGGNR